MKLPNHLTTLNRTLFPRSSFPSTECRDSRMLTVLQHRHAHTDDPQAPSSRCNDGSWHVRNEGRTTETLLRRAFLRVVAGHRVGSHDIVTLQLSEKEKVTWTTRS